MTAEDFASRAGGLERPEPRTIYDVGSRNTGFMRELHRFVTAHIIAFSHGLGRKPTFGK
jgi:hypothetical protein